MVAPARERGLKSQHRKNHAKFDGRSREGAWIEIWEVMCAVKDFFVAPARERGLKYLRRG